MFKRAMKSTLEKEFTHPERHDGEQLFLQPEEPLLTRSFVNKEHPETVITASVSLKGTLSFERSLRLDGSFEGELLAQGRLHVGPSGTVKADLNLQSALIEGYVEGNIHVEDHLEIRATAVIKGDITAKTLSVEPGASLIGSVLIEPQNAEHP